ncbi:MAG: hypothetical protein OXG99_17715 [Alphaproteobacteria bacterium]|nr:hypothetical protein [Alphaproteobacteria bacterium]
MSDFILAARRGNEDVLPCVYLTGDDLRALYRAVADRESILCRALRDRIAGFIDCLPPEDRP